MIYELLDMTNWKTLDELITEAKSKGFPVDRRSLRNIFKKNNILYAEHAVDIFIAHSNKGYKATQDREEIRNSILDNHKRAINMLSEESHILKAMGENLNYNLVINNNEFIYVDSQGISYGDTEESQG